MNRLEYYIVMLQDILHPTSYQTLLNRLESEMPQLNYEMLDHPLYAQEVLYDLLDMNEGEFVNILNTIAVYDAIISRKMQEAVSEFSRICLITKIRNLNGSLNSLELVAMANEFILAQKN